MKKLTLVLIPILCLFASCAPKITTTIIKPYPSLQPDAPIEVLFAQRIPAKAEEIGQVRISDSGVSTNCDSLTVINKIKDEARKAGGNTIIVTKHTKPSIWGSSCHQMTATVLNVSDFSDKDIAANERRYMSENAIIDSLYKTKNERLLPKFNLSANVGYGWRTAKTADGLGRDEKQIVDDLKSGFVWDISANYYINDNFGLGISNSNYSSSTSAYGEHNDSGNSGTIKFNDRITYIGPAFLMRFSQNQKWIFNISLGIGYLGYSSESKLDRDFLKVTGSTVGFESRVGVEHKLAENWGIGISLSSHSGILSTLNVNDNGHKKTIDLDKDNKEGLGRIQLGIGMRYYIK
ncbi:porin family protein [Dysgonomonas sp. 216]|uniref:outer membrane beta-barrel protein n=1 Tax=Dysgonomonas sp. 216 TaxID=2302934 RepID=UPI0013D1A843|nr:outer membrane beta-barrel protein [Dysgonomonas sp. 216]NDW18214.1 porin family protein [Dysgonomonas sp. 216]